jgi:hypothetical protein
MIHEKLNRVSLKAFLSVKLPPFGSCQKNQNPLTAKASKALFKDRKELNYIALTL